MKKRNLKSYFALVLSFGSIEKKNIKITSKTCNKIQNICYPFQWHMLGDGLDGTYPKIPSLPFLSANMNIINVQKQCSSCMVVKEIISH